MPTLLLPASAAAFAPRSAPTIVLNSNVEPAIWTLSSIMLPKAPDSELRKDSNPLVEALFNYQFVHVEAYIVHVDMVSQHEVAFKLTQDTIDALVEYHKDIYSVDMAASTWDWAEKEVQLKKLQEEFVQAANRFVYRTAVRALEGLEEEGAGELLEGRGDEVKSAIMNLFQPLLPPPPRIVDVVRPAPLLPSSTDGGNWWQPTQALPAPQQNPFDCWRVLPSTPSPTVTACSDTQPSIWSGTNLAMPDMQLPSPTPSISLPYSSCDEYYSPPQAPVPLAALPLPSVLAQCGASVTNDGFGGFAWSYNDFAPQYATIM